MTVQEATAEAMGEALREELQQALGVRLSRKLAWKIYRTALLATCRFMQGRETAEQRLSLYGIGVVEYSSSAKKSRIVCDIPRKYVEQAPESADRPLRKKLVQRKLGEETVTQPSVETEQPPSSAEAVIPLPTKEPSKVLKKERPGSLTREPWKDRTPSGLFNPNPVVEVSVPLRKRSKGESSSNKRGVRKPSHTEFRPKNTML